MTKISQLSSIGDSLAIGDQFLIRDIDDTGSPNKSVTVSGITRALDLGTAAAPAIAFASDKNTGIYSPGADQLAVATNGVGRLFVGANPHVGVGITPNASSASSQVLEVGPSTFSSIGNACYQGANWFYTGAAYVYKNSDAASQYIQGGGDHIWLSAASGTAGNAITFNERLRITSAGLVGIGTTAPIGCLEITGASLPLVLQSTVAAANYITHRYHLAGTDLAYIGAGGGAALTAGTANDYAIRANLGALLFGTNGNNERLRITSAGNVGIGTSSPGYLLDVVGTVNANATFRASNGTQIGIFGSEAFSAGVVGVGSGSNHPLVLGTNSTERLRIDSSGNVGIGTTSPSYALDVRIATSSANTGARIYNSTAGTGNSASLSFSVANVFSSTNQHAAIQAISEVSTNTLTSLAFLTSGGSNAGNATERLRINSSGNVGIGTTSPGSMLTVNDPGTGLAFTNAASGNYNIGLLGGTGSQEAYIYQRANAPLIIGTNNTERARIDSSGRLLVGTSTARTNFFNTVATAALQIEGNNGNTGSLSIIRNSADAGQSVLLLGKTRGASVGSTTIVQSGDVIGQVDFQGSDGTEFVSAAVISGEVDGTPGANDMPGRLVFSVTADGAASPTERMRIGSTGNLNIGRISDLAVAPRISVESTNFGVAINTSNGGANEAMRFYNANTAVGTITTTGSATAYNTSSDYRLKENVTAVADGITRLQQLKPSRFNFIADPDHTVDGFIAHEAAEVVPECVTGEKDAVDADGNPVYQGIDQSKLVPLLTAALQEAIGKIETLEARLTAAGID